MRYAMSLERCDFNRSLGESDPQRLSAKPHPGPGKSISREDQQKLLDAVKLGALHWGFSVDRWTAKRIADVCQRVTNMDFHPDHIRKLMHALGFSPQKPQRKAFERDETAITAWLETTHPELVKRGRRKRDDPLLRRNRLEFERCDWDDVG